MLLIPSSNAIFIHFTIQTLFNDILFNVFNDMTQFFLIEPLVVPLLQEQE